jgi:LmbE family N-acetylglucosaminyl deacetylase
MILTFKVSDRLLVLAPHPDDESLATGGLIQRAKEVGARVRVIFATNGDNNPWPQRWVEKRWQIGANERRRWGALRRREARKALQQLGLAEKPCFLNLPDQGITGKLLEALPEPVERLCREIEEWQPTCLVIPSPNDQHPDHNALYVLIQIALERMGRTDLRQIQFLVHCRRPDWVPHLRELLLTEPERLTKRLAIRCHATQMVLSRKRFLSYARTVENYYGPVLVEPVLEHHPLGEAWVAAGALNLHGVIPAPWRSRGSILIAGESPEGGSLRWQLKLPAASQKVRLRDASTGELLRYATVRITGKFMQIKIPLSLFQPLSRLFVKLDRRNVFLDTAGWREVPVF